MSDHINYCGLWRRLGSLAGIMMLLLLGLGSLGAAAHAEGVSHNLENTIKGTELPQGTFGEILGLAVDNSNGPSGSDVYVYEANLQTFPKAGMIDKFDGDGKYLGVQITGSQTPQGVLLPAINPSSGRSSGIAVDGSSSPNKGDIYVGDIEHHVVDKFSESGAFLCQITAKPPASRSTAEAAHECDGATGSETPQESIEPTGIAVDSSGNVYVSDRQHEVIDEFSPSGAYLGQISDPSIGKASALSVAPDGDIYMLNWKSNIVKFSAAGTFLSSFDELEAASENAEPTAMAVDPTNGHVYAVDRFPEPPSTLQEYGEADELLGTLASEQLREKPYALGLAVSHATGDLYAAELSDEPGAAVYVFSPDLSAGAPTIKSESSWNTTATSSEVRAKIEPSDLATTCKVQYVDEEQFRASGYDSATTVGCTPESFPASFVTSTASVQLTGLQLDTTYHYRFIVANSAAPDGVIGPEETFSTFGIQSFSIGAFGPAAEVDALAGSHPYELTTTFALHATTVPGKGSGAEANPRDVEVELPPGLIGNPDAVARCAPYNVAHADCSGASQVGVLKVAGTAGGITESPLYNLVPPAGVAAQFGARFNGYVTAHIDAKVRTGGDYGVTADSLYVSSAEGLVGASVTLWGVPSDSRHDPERSCPAPNKINESHFPEAPYTTQPCTERGLPVPFLSNPTSCTGPRAISVHIDSWQEPGTFVGASDEMPAIIGCGKLDFKPSMVVAPTSKAADSPSGLDVELKVPQNEDPTGLAEADLKDAKVTLPAGVTVNPSSAGGLVGCPLLSGKGSHAGQSGIDLENGEPANCPEASKVGKVTIETPLLEKPLTGGVYVAQQNVNPFKSLLALYIAVEDAERGVVVKLAGHVELNPTTGQLTTTFDENPQLPFEDLKLDFFGGERAALATPRTCGSYQPAALLEPFSHQGASGEEGTPNAEPSIDPFEITSGPGGSACGEPPFAPSFEAGTADVLGGSFSPFTMTLRRNDGEQRFSTVATTLPPGLAGMISKVMPCANALAEAGDCPTSSKIGHVTVEAGVGGEPVTLPQAGKPEDPVYLSEKYGGAPFGLSIVVPAEAGPFNLGTVVVRASIMVDSRTGQVSVRSDSLPTILQGVPVDLRTVNVVIDRPGFIFNPTDCKPLNVIGAITSTEGSVAAVSSHFQTADCGALAFKPAAKAETHAYHSRKKGSYLKVTITSKQGEANLAKVDVTLPKKLPADLETLKEACTEAQFAKNPAGCPKAAFVGSVIVHTPVLSKALTGPAIYVSHGGVNFPDLALVLQGEGITIIQEGNTNISKGFTSSSFNAIPDLPVSSVEVMLPESDKPALGGNGGDLCGELVTKRVKSTVHGRFVYRKRRVRRPLALYMPTRITGQNGAVMEQKTKLTVRGCHS